MDIFEANILVMGDIIKKININYSFIFFLFSNIFSLVIDGQIDEEISKAEQEISTLRESAPDKINTIAIETSCCDTSKS